jgi:hypothetical protein
MAKPNRSGRALPVDVEWRERGERERENLLINLQCHLHAFFFFPCRRNHFLGDYYVCGGR